MIEARAVSRPVRLLRRGTQPPGALKQPPQAGYTRAHRPSCPRRATRMRAASGGRGTPFTHVSHAPRPAAASTSPRLQGEGFGLEHNMRTSVSVGGAARRRLHAFDLVRSPTLLSQTHARATDDDTGGDGGEGGGGGDRAL